MSIINLKINREALYYLLRYGRKSDGAWNEVKLKEDEFLPDDYDIDSFIEAWEFYRLIKDTPLYHQLLPLIKANLEKE